MTERIRRCAECIHFHTASFGFCSKKNEKLTRTKIWIDCDCDDYEEDEHQIMMNKIILKIYEGMREYQEED